MIGDLPGKGFYLWVLSRCEGGNATKILDRSDGAGGGHLLIKCADGAFEYNERSLIASVVLEAKDRGTPTGGWHYVYDFDPSTAEVARAQIKRFGLKAWVIDGEKELKLPFHANAPDVRNYIADCRAAGAEKIYLTSYRYPSVHRDFPWASFLGEGGVDAMMPDRKSVV